ncbi:MAG: hypothetical protein DRJ52_07015 [Thermoprotei archaeon]|nr:MAG: hypothetical protein DRJ52_07015 [Thermoprotei archaeon]
MSQDSAAYALERICEVLERLIYEVQITRTNLRSALDNLDSLIRSETNVKLDAILDEVEKTRLDVAARLILFKSALLAIDYLRYDAREKALLEYLSFLESKMKESENILKEKYAEVIKDYLNLIENILDQFMRISSGEFEILQHTLKLEKDVSFLYDLLKPEYVDRDIVDLAMQVDVDKRLKSIQRIKDRLSKAAKMLEEASTSVDRLKKSIADYEFDSIRKVKNKAYLFLPVLRVEVCLDGRKESIITGPVLRKGSISALSTKAAKTVSFFIENFPATITKRELAEIKKRVLKLATSDDEVRLIEEAFR